MANTSILKLAGEALPEGVDVVRYEAHERLSVAYRVEVHFLVPATTSFVVADCLRTSMLLTLVGSAGGTRFFHGVVSSAQYIDFTGEKHHFVVHLRPAFSALAQRENCKIWQDTNVVDIAKEIFEEAGFADNVEWQLNHSHEGREYIVQYRETELNFVLRMFEDEGLMFLFRHRPEGHTMVIGDDIASFVASDDAPDVTFSMSPGYGDDPIDDFRRRRSLRTTSVHLRDYDFEKPQVPVEAILPSADGYPMPFYEYPGGFLSGAVGNVFAAARLRARRRDMDVALGTSKVIGLRCGVPFSLAGAAQPWLDGDYVVTELHTEGEQGHEESVVCQNRFQAIPKETPYLPERRARRPKIAGVQTAVVTGPSSDAEAIHVDKYGRIKVRFFWDRIGQQDDTSSCWLRVSQTPTGGSMMLPRVGWEMGVAFMDGDPDRPFSMGRIYNGEKVPPAALPGAKASGGLKSYSTPGGAGINELNLSDSGGSMGWTLNAQKDLNVTILNDKKETIAVDSSHDIKTNATSSIGSNEVLDVAGDQSESVGSMRSSQVTGSQNIVVGGNETNNSISNMLEKVGANREYKVGGNMTIISNTVMQTVTGDFSRDVSAVQLSASIASITDQIGGNYSETVSVIKIEACWGTSSETVGGDKNATSIAAELHILLAGQSMEAGSTATYLVGGVHYQKIDGDLSVKAPLVTLLGATGDFKGGKGNLKLAGGPIVAKGSKIVAEAMGINVKLGSSLKIG